jgi:hypothetical protein
MISVLSLWPAGAALVGVLAQHGAAYAVFGVQRLHSEGLPRSARIALERALAQNISNDMYYHASFRQSTVYPNQTP